MAAKSYRPEWEYLHRHPLIENLTPAQMRAVDRTIREMPTAESDAFFSARHTAVEHMPAARRRAYKRMCRKISDTIAASHPLVHSFNKFTKRLVKKRKKAKQKRLVNLTKNWKAVKGNYNMVD